MPNQNDPHVDITGTMHQSIPDWQPRVEALCKPERFEVSINPDYMTCQSLTEEERERLRWKLKLVERFASYMAAGMLKGTLKYSTDAYGVDKWMAHLLGEGADQANYQLLLANDYFESTGRSL